MQKTNKFQEGDILSKIGDPRKWLVWEVDSYEIELKDMNAYMDDEISEDYSEWDSLFVRWNEAEMEWVKVGEWSFKYGEEMSYYD